LAPYRSKILIEDRSHGKRGAYYAVPSAKWQILHGFLEKQDYLGQGQVLRAHHSR
jgi:hypothetical protein